jgi:hypothetical protein
LIPLLANSPCISERSSPCFPSFASRHPVLDQPRCTTIGSYIEAQELLNERILWFYVGSVERYFNPLLLTIRRFCSLLLTRRHAPLFREKIGIFCLPYPDNNPTFLKFTPQRCTICELIQLLMYRS